MIEKYKPGQSQKRKVGLIKEMIGPHLKYKYGEKITNKTQEYVIVYFKRDLSEIKLIVCIIEYQLRELAGRDHI